MKERGTSVVIRAAGPWRSISAPWGWSTGWLIR